MSQSLFLSVGFAVVLGMIVFGERHTTLVWAAMGLILIGVFLVNARRVTPPRG